MECPHCKTILADSSRQCSVCFAPLAGGGSVSVSAAAPAAQSASTGVSRQPTPSYLLPPGQAVASPPHSFNNAQHAPPPPYVIPASVLPPRSVSSIAQRKTQGGGWGILGFGGGSLGIILVILRVAFIAYRSSERQMEREAAQKRENVAMPRAMQASSGLLPSPGFSGQARQMPRPGAAMPSFSSPVMPGAQIPDLSAQRRQMQDRMAAGRQRAQQQQQQQQQVQQQMDETRARAHASMPPPMMPSPMMPNSIPGQVRGLGSLGPPGFPRPAGPGSMPGQMQLPGGPR